MAVEGLATNTVALREWSSQIFGDEGLDLTAAVEALVHASERVREGSLGELEMLLASQVIAMNAIFANLASRAKQATYMDHFDKYMRMALKAQGQCRATVETLALMKNPPVFARQANISGGPQQVNNGPVLNITAHAEISEPVPNRLLEANERLDGCTTQAAGNRDSALATVGAVNRSDNSGG